MFANDELCLFVDWMLSDVAERAPSGKNPTTALNSFAINYQQPDPSKRGKAGVRGGAWARIRGSDLAMRRYVVIRVLRKHGLSLQDACYQVCKRLHKETDKDFESIRVGFEKYRHPLRNWWTDNFVNDFKNWIAWEVQENLIERGVSLETYASVVQAHAQSVCHDESRAKEFAERRTELACRAILLLAAQGKVRACPATTAKPES
jgi:hypothetical protein